MIAALIPFLDFIFAALAIYLLWALTLRESFLISATLAASWLVLGTEGLSLFRVLHFVPVLLWWLVPLPCLVFAVIRNRKCREFFQRRPHLKLFDYTLIAGLAVILGWSWCQAVFCPPNNADSQEYHLQRQVFWMQQGSVEHFPTSNLRQVAMPPLTEFAGLNLIILTGNDRYHNLVQWFALVLTLFAVSLLTRRFNGSATAQLLAAFWTATIPLAFLQASNTKNDVTVMLWVCLLAYWVLLLDRPLRLRWAHVSLIGLAFGALALTKGTGVIFGFPIAALAGFYLLRRHLKFVFPALGLIAVLALLVNAGHFVRNYRAFQSVAPDKPGIHAGPALGNEDHSPGALLSNMLRSIGSHCVIPSKVWNDKVSDWMQKIHEKLGRSIDDPRTTWMPLGRFRPYQFWQDDEDRAAAPAHLLLLLLLPAVMLWARKQLPWRAVMALLFIFLAGFVLFSFLLKWQNWHVRLIIPLPAVIAPIFAWCCSARRIRYVAPFAALLLFVTLVPSFNCIQRPLAGPKNIFHADPLALRCYYHPEWPAQYRELEDRIAEMHPKVIGFFTGTMSPDYPMQRLLLDQLTPPPVLTAFNGTLQVPGKIEPDPDVLLVARTNINSIQHVATGTWYALDSRVGRYALFFKGESKQSY